MKQIQLFLVVFGLILSAGTQLPAGDLEDLQGTWNAVSLERGGMPAPEEVVKDTEFVFIKDIFRIRSKKKNAIEKSFTFILDETTKPKSMDVVPDQGPGKGKQLPIAIYQLNGDKLVLCIQNNNSSTERPEKFETTKDDDLVLVKLERVKASE